MDNENSNPIVRGLGIQSALFDDEFQRLFGRSENFGFEKLSRQGTEIVRRAKFAGTDVVQAVLERPEFLIVADRKFLDVRQRFGFLVRIGNADNRFGPVFVFDLHVHVDLSEFHSGESFCSHIDNRSRSAFCQVTRCKQSDTIFNPSRHESCILTIHAITGQTTQLFTFLVVIPILFHAKIGITTDWHDF